MNLEKIPYNMSVSELDYTSPFRGLVGFKLERWRENYARFSLNISPEHLNRGKVPHGGVYATMLDTAMAYSGTFSGHPDERRFSLTVSMNVQFLARPIGRVLTVEASRVGGGKSIFFAESVISDDEKVRIASATGVFKLCD